MDFFVYLHRRASNGKVFYVGKGTRYRHRSKWNRSKHWHNIVAKHGYTIEIVQAGMQEWWAFELERELILKYQNHGLCNRTDGGEGASGCVVSPETKEKHRKLRLSKEWRENLSLKAKLRFANPEYKKLHSESKKKAMNRPEVKEKLRQAALIQFSSKEARKAIGRKTTEYFSNQKNKELIRQKALARFDTPEKRAAHAQAKTLSCLDNGMVFGSAMLAAEWVTSWRGAKADNSLIAKAARGLIPHAYKLRWQYINSPMEVLG
jgi:hypothetical protein